MINDLNSTLRNKVDKFPDYTKLFCMKTKTCDEPKEDLFKLNEQMNTWTMKLSVGTGKGQIMIFNDIG